MTNILENKRVYLSSPMEQSKDNNWRHKVKETLTDEFKLKVFDPHDDPKQSDVAYIKKYKEENDFENLRIIARSFVHKDLQIVSRCDILIAYIPYGVPTTGVVHEIINSVNDKKITLLVEGTCKTKLPTWYFGFIPHEFMFGTWDELYEFLNKVNKGEYEKNDRFYFFYNYPDAWLR